MDLHAICLWIPLLNLLNAWANLYETSYVRHGTWFHFSGAFHKFLPAVCVSVCVYLLWLLGKGSVKCIHPFFARQRLGKHVPASVNTLNNRRIVERMCLPVYPPIDARSQLSKDVPAATKKCWRHRFLCGTFYVKEKYGIGSSRNFLFLCKIQKVGWIHPSVICRW
jgi:hypothetical protein